MVALTENEKSKLETIMAVRGYKEYKSTFFETDEYQKLRTVMLDNLPIQDDQRLKFKFCDKSELLRAGKYVLEKHCDNIDLKVPYTNGHDLKSQLVCRFGEKPSEEKYDEIAEYVKNNIELVKVTDLPVLLNIGQGRNGHVKETWFYNFDDIEKSFFEKIPVCVSEIGVFGPCDEYLKTTYVHEMYHALLDRHKGSINNLLNTEFLSIFMEKVAAYDLDDSCNLLELRHLKRLLNIKIEIVDKTLNDFKEQKAADIIDSEKYIISTLLATDLFNTYMKGSNKLRKEIDASINEVLMGNSVIEDVIDKYEVSLEKGSKIMKKQIKQFS